MTHGVLFSATAALSLIVSSQAFAQQLVNGDFEQPGMQGAPPSGWTSQKGTFICDSAKHKSGSFSGKIDGGDHDSAVYQDVPVTAGQSYVLEGFWRNGDKTAAFDVARATIMWLTAPGGIELGKPTSESSGEVASNWTEFRVGPALAPKGAGAARIRLAATFNTAAFDNVEWNSAAPASPAEKMKPLSGTPITAKNQKRERPKKAGDSANTQEPKPVTDDSKESASEAVKWLTDIAEGYRTAARSGKRTIVFFSGDSDENTRYFENSLFSDSKIRTIMSKNYVAIQVDYESNRAIVERLHIKSPGALAIYDDNGAAVALITEQVSVSAFETVLLK